MFTQSLNICLKGLVLLKHSKYKNLSYSDILPLISSIQIRPFWPPNTVEILFSFLSEEDSIFTIE